MNINTKDARYILLNRIQCMRTVNERLDEQIDILVEKRAICCGYYSGSSSSSNSQPEETFYVLAENNAFTLNENGNFEVTENA